MIPFSFRCPLLFFTGIHCPTCGLGRGLIAAVQGQWGLSWSYHPLAIPSLLLLAITVAGLFCYPIPTKALGRRIRNFLRAHPRLATVAVALYSVWGFARWLDV